MGLLTILRMTALGPTREEKYRMDVIRETSDKIGLTRGPEQELAESPILAAAARRGILEAANPWPNIPEIWSWENFKRQTDERTPLTTREKIEFQFWCAGAGPHPVDGYTRAWGLTEAELLEKITREIRGGNPPPTNRGERSQHAAAEVYLREAGAKNPPDGWNLTPAYFILASTQNKWKDYSRRPTIFEQVRFLWWEDGWDRGGTETNLEPVSTAEGAEVLRYSVEMLGGKRFLKRCAR